MSANIWRRPNKSIPDVTNTMSIDLLLNLLYSNMTSFICHINNTTIKLPLYFNSLMRIDEQIINIISEFILDRDAYKHNNSRIASWDTIFSRKKTLKTTIYRLWLLFLVVFRWRSLLRTLVTLAHADSWFILQLCEHFRFLSH